MGFYITIKNNEGVGKQRGEMAQTMYAHINK
jgi:hypothetical protein